MSIRPAPLCPPSWRACSGGQHRPLLSSDINRRLRDSSPHTPPLLALRAARELFPKPSRLRITAGTQMQPAGPGSPWSARARGQSWQPPAPPATISELSKHAGWPAVYCTPHGGLCRRHRAANCAAAAGGRRRSNWPCLCGCQGHRQYTSARPHPAQSRPCCCHRSSRSLRHPRRRNAVRRGAAAARSSRQRPERRPQRRQSRRADEAKCRGGAVGRGGGGGGGACWSQ